MNNFKYIIKRSKRKTIEIGLIDCDTLVIKCPLSFNDDRIEELIKNKEKWIESKREHIKNRIQLKVDELYFQDRIIKKKINIQPFLKKDFVSFYNDQLIINIKRKENYNKTLDAYLKVLCLERVMKYVSKYKNYFNVQMKEIKIKKVRRRWGSCTYDNRLMFNMYLALAPDNAVEYVVVHEMCHMIHKNHSKEFYNEVEKLLPSFEDGDMWLKKYGYLIIKPEL